MGYKVVKYFTDLKDNNHAYHPGDSFPRDGAIASEGRIKELAGTTNRRGVPLIEEVVEPKPEPVMEPVSEPEPKPEVKPKRASKAKGKKVNKNAE
jgi:hypothetical protein